MDSILAARRWRSPDPNTVGDLFAGIPNWWIAGGWAIDLFVGTPTRQHSDLDIGCFRDDLPVVLAKLTGWDVRIARDGILYPYSEDCSMPFHGLWCRPETSEEWAIEILVEERHGQEWVFRRDHRVRRPANDIQLRTPGGVPFLCPEIQLLYKAKNPREQDALDLAAALPRLSAEARTWLEGAIQLTTPSSPWRSEHPDASPDLRQRKRL